MPSHTYSTYVTPPGQSEITLGSNYAFRTEQAAAISLNYSSKYNLIGDANVTNVTVTTSDTTPPSVALLTDNSQIGANLQVCADEENRADFDQRR